jgi:hypothetical protein
MTVIRSKTGSGYIDVRTGYGISFGSDVSRSAANTAGLVSALTEAVARGKRGVYLGSQQIVYDSLRFQGSSLHLWGHHPQLTSTLGKTSNTIAIQLVGSDLTVEDLILDYTVPLDVDADAAARGDDGKTLRIGGERNGLFGQVGNLWTSDIAVRNCIIRDARNTPIEVWFGDHAHVGNNTIERSLGNGIFTSCVREDLEIVSNSITDCGDDNIFVACDSNNPDLTKGVRIAHNHCRKSYAKNIGVSGVDGGIIEGNHCYESWAPAIEVIQDGGLEGNNNIKIKGNQIYDAGSRYGPGQYQTAVNVNADGIYITNNPSNVTIEGNDIIGADGRGITVETATTIKIKGNTILDTAATGMKLGDPSDATYTRLLNLTLEGNTLVRVGGGIDVGSVTGFSIANNLIRSYKNGASGSRRGLFYGYIKKGQIGTNTYINDDGGAETILQYSGHACPDTFVAAQVSVDSTDGTADAGAFPVTIGTVSVLSGTGSPEGAISAPVGSLYLRSDGSHTTSLYVKQNFGGGNTGWGQPTVLIQLPDLSAVTTTSGVDALVPGAVGANGMIGVDNTNHVLYFRMGNRWSKLGGFTQLAP